MVAIVLFLASACHKETRPLNLSPTEKENIVGEYFGIINSDQQDCPSVTRIFFKNENLLLGTYEYDEGHIKTNGQLYDFIRITENKLQCKWKDKYGMGTLILVFSEDFNSFSGKWSDTSTVNQYYWNGKK